LPEPINRIARSWDLAERILNEERETGWSTVVDRVRSESDFERYFGRLRATAPPLDLSKLVNQTWGLIHQSTLQEPSPADALEILQSHLEKLYRTGGGYRDLLTHMSLFLANQ
jgi:hypothetical protein